MKDKEKIRAEILRRKNTWNHADPQYVAGGKDVCDYLLGFIDSLPEELISEDLEEVADRYAVDKYNKYCNDPTILANMDGDKLLRKTFEDGANWQKEQMMKDAVEREAKIDAGGYPYIDCNIELYDYDKDVPFAKKGDKVKLIIIKEEEK